LNEPVHVADLDIAESQHPAVLANRLGVWASTDGHPIQVSPSGMPSWVHRRDARFVPGAVQGDPVNDDILVVTAVAAAFGVLASRPPGYALSTLACFLAAGFLIDRGFDDPPILRSMANRGGMT
jgi:hypothetical protein